MNNEQQSQQFEHHIDQHFANHFAQHFEHPNYPDYPIEQAGFSFGHGAGWVLPFLFLTPFLFGRHGGYNGGAYPTSYPLPYPYPYPYPLPTFQGTQDLGYPTTYGTFPGYY